MRESQSFYRRILIVGILITVTTALELKQPGRKVCGAIGVFDGVHLGHQQIIRQTLSDARRQGAFAVVITFDKHPNAIVAPQRMPPMIHPVAHKLELIRNLGADATLLIPFDKSFSEKPAEVFIRELAADFGRLSSLCVGSAFTFGHNRGGDVNLLTELGKELGFTVHGHASVALDGKLVSSTRIRKMIQEGQLDVASQMLGQPYAIVGQVIEGNKLGRTIGFPTANVNTEGLCLPPNGVYACNVQLEGNMLKGALNIGIRPSVKQNSPKICVEAHLLDFEGDIYGKHLEIIPLRMIRSEQTFPSLDTLKEQILRDVEVVAKMF